MADPTVDPATTGEPSRRSTGARVVRWLVLAVLAAIAVVVLFEVVFPWFEVNYYDPSIG
jgi:hypothetical protein